MCLKHLNFYILKVAIASIIFMNYFLIESACFAAQAISKSLS